MKREIFAAERRAKQKCLFGLTLIIIGVTIASTLGFFHLNQIKREVDSCDRAVRQRELVYRILLLAMHKRNEVPPPVEVPLQKALKELENIDSRSDHSNLRKAYIEATRQIIDGDANENELKKLQRVLQLGIDDTGSFAEEVNKEIDDCRDHMDQIIANLTKHFVTSTVLLLIGLFSFIGIILVPAINQLKQIHYDMATELEDKNEEFRRLGKTFVLKDLVAAISHDGRNALQQVQGAAEMLSLNIEDESKLKRCVVNINEGVDRLHRMFNDIGDFTTVTHLDFEKNRLDDIWRRAWYSLKDFRAGKEIRFSEIGGPPNAHLEIPCDEQKMLKVFVKVLKNAIDACASQVWIEINPTLEGVEIIVFDDGEAFDEREKIFEAFYTTKPMGAGLGLTVARTLVEAHGGHIEAVEAKGSKGVKIYLPRGSVNGSESE